MEEDKLEPLDVCVADDDWLEPDDGSERDSEAMEEIEERSVLGAEPMDPSRVDASINVMTFMPIPSFAVAGINKVVVPSFRFICCRFG